MLAESRRTRAHIDWLLIFMVMAMSIFGIVAVCVATYSTSSTSDTSFLNHIFESSYAVRQCLFVLVAPLIFGVIMSMPLEWLKRYTTPVYWGCLVLLIVVTVFNRAAGVKAWLDIIWGYTIQPSEFAKLATILMMAKILTAEEVPLNNARSFFRCAITIGVTIVVIFLQGETGSLLVIIFLCAVMMYFGNCSPKLLWGLFGLGVMLVLSIYFIMLGTGSDDYRLARITGFLNPDLYSSSDSYQMKQSQMAIGSGGLTGKGMFVDGALSQLNYVPADWTDFIYATIGEAWGFIGCVSVLVGYMLILLRILQLSWFTRDRYGRLIILGVEGMLLFHVFENIAMTLGLMPITGIPLPFLSYGGSNMVTNMGGIGLVLNVTRNRSLTGSSSSLQLQYNPYHLKKRFVNRFKNR